MPDGLASRTNLSCTDISRPVLPPSDASAGAVPPPKSLATWIALAFAFSGALNLLHLALPLYSMHLFNRVLPTGNYATLLLLTFVTIGVLLAALLLEGARSALLVRAAAHLDARLYAKAAAVAMRPGAGNALRDAEAVRAFGTSPLSTAVLDAPWCLVFLVAIFLISSSLGWIAVAALATSGLTAIGGWWANRDLKAVMARASAATAAELEAAWASPHAVRSMGARNAILARLATQRRFYAAAAGRSAERQAWIEAAGRAVRQIALVASFFAAVILVLDGSVAPGALVAVSLLFGRVTIALERLGYSSHGLQLVWKAYHSLRDAAAPPDFDSGPGYAPLRGAVSLDGASVHPPGLPRAVLGPINLTLRPGEVVVVVGAEGAGKSTFARLLTGAISPTGGSIRLDGHDPRILGSDWLGPQVGFLPEDTELGAGTVASVVSRGAAVPDRAAVVAAAGLAGVHRAIQKLPLGYDTPVGGINDHPLSAGARRRLGLARALYRWPALVVLDDPTAHLDPEGEVDIVRVVGELASRGSTVVVVSRFAGLLHVADRLVMLEAGRVTLDAGPSEIRARVGGPRAATL